MMNKKISLWQLIAIGFVFVAVVYFFGVHRPVSQQMQELSDKQGSIDAEISLASIKATEMQTMEAKVEAADEADVSLPTYNNLDEVLLELNNILDNSKTYEILFSDAVPDEKNYTMARNLSVKFETTTYANMQTLLRQMNASKFKYLFEDVSISQKTNSNEQTETYSASVKITGYEQVDLTAQGGEAQQQTAAQENTAN